jgi:hypothetical protein
MACGTTQRIIMGDYSNDWILRTLCKSDGVWYKYPDQKRNKYELSGNKYVNFSDDPSEKDYSAEKTKLEADIATIVDEIELLANNNIIGVSINIGESCVHCFVLSNKEITDSYVGEHEKETRTFDYDNLVELLNNPTQEMWNKMFNCEQFEMSDSDISLEIYIPE